MVGIAAIGNSLPLVPLLLPAKTIMMSDLAFGETQGQHLDGSFFEDAGFFAQAAAGAMA